jgi:hypothetical protein
MHKIFEAYEPPLTDGFLHVLAHEVRMGGAADVDDLVQEGRIRMWQLWQEAQWDRSIAPRGTSFYAKAVKRRMQALLYRHAPAYGNDSARQGYTDVMRHASSSLSFSDQDGMPPEIARLIEETPFELLDRMPAVLVGLIG